MNETPVARRTPRPSSRYRTWSLYGGAALLSLLGFGLGHHLSGDPGATRREGGEQEKNRRSRAAAASRTSALDSGHASSASADDPGFEGIILAQRKRIMGRLRSLEQVRRVATSIRPLVDRAIEQPEIQSDLRALASEAGMSLADYKEYFKDKQEADLLLESGGDPNARSVSDAIGVAQFLAGTGRRRGLRVDLGASNVLSRQIAAIERQIEALEERPEGWSSPAPAAVSEEASQLPGGSAVAWTRDEWLAYRKSQWERLVAKRRRVDERFDPEKAIRVQTRYLVELTRRFGGIDWALQAYHGGEAGAAKTVGLFGAAGASRSRLASRGAGARSSRWPPYSELYARVTPTATPAAFSYLFGRSDDHRYYWWKVLMAERALELYRRDPSEFERQWQALKPGYSADVAWYPEPDTLRFEDNAALRAAYRSGELVPLPPGAAALGIRTENLAALVPSATSLHKGLRPEAMGALLRLAGIYRGSGGGTPLTVVSMVQSAAYRNAWEHRYPAPPLPPGVPRDPEYHSTGLVFHVKRPGRDWDRKVLEFALGRLADQQRVSWRKVTEAGSRRYHVVVNPAHREELAAAHLRVAASR